MKKKLLTVTLKFQSCGVMNGLQMSTFHPNPFHFTRLAILLSQNFTNAIARIYEITTRMPETDTSSIPFGPSYQTISDVL
jgi:hypothetical protein